MPWACGNGGNLQLSATTNTGSAVKQMDSKL